tara:strand:- start:4385 stop:5452 length:1068 start_codon:yes stop_codon:yes gene_type:complete
MKLIEILQNRITLTALLLTLVTLTLFFTALFIKLENRDLYIRSFNNIYDTKASRNEIVGQTSNNVVNEYLINCNVLTAFNCCNIYEYKNSYVSLEALKNCIKLGARCLDMQVFSYNNIPIVASSISDSKHIKHTFNELILEDVFNYIYKNVFISRIDKEIDNTIFGCPSPQDPIIIHIRVMSTNPDIYRKIINSYKSQFGEKCYIGIGDLHKKKIQELREKSILIINPYKNRVDILNNIIGENKNASRINCISRTDKITSTNKEYAILASNDNPNTDAILYQSILSILIPDTSRTNINITDNYWNNNGVQKGIVFTSMIFQPIQNNREVFNKYYKYFKDKGGAIIRKDNNRMSSG